MLRGISRNGVLTGGERAYGSVGSASIYESADGCASYFDLGAAAMRPVPEPEGILVLKSLEQRSKTVERNAGASLIDLGDGVVCCEFHTKMNALGGDIFGMLQAGVRRLETDFDAMVVANQGDHFSAGANLMLLLVAAQEQDWDEIDLAVRQFQRVTQSIRYAPKPVVVAPHGMTLGGGCAALFAIACTPSPASPNAVCTSSSTAPSASSAAPVVESAPPPSNQSTTVRVSALSK